MTDGTGGLHWRVPVITAALVTFLSALLTRRWMEGGGFPPAVPWLTLVLLLVIAGLVLRFGYAVRSYQRGRGADLSAIRAARTLALAQAAAVTGAAVGGLYLGQLLAVLPDRDLRVVQGLTGRFTLAVLAAGLVSAAGLVAQHWCRIPPRDSDTEGGREA